MTTTPDQIQNLVEENDNKRRHDPTKALSDWMGGKPWQHTGRRGIMTNQLEN